MISAARGHDDADQGDCRGALLFVWSFSTADHASMSSVAYFASRVMYQARERAYAAIASCR